MLTGLRLAAKLTGDGEVRTREEVREICARLRATDPAPMVATDGRPFNCLGMMREWRRQSRERTEQLQLQWSKFLDAEHSVALAKIENCTYFGLLDLHNAFDKLSDVAEYLWEYVTFTQELEAYVNRRAASIRRP